MVTSSIRERVEAQLAAELGEQPTAAFCQRNDYEVTKRVRAVIVQVTDRKRGWTWRQTCPWCGQPDGPHDCPSDA